VIATLLLVVVSVFNRVNESFDRLLVLLPMVALAIFAAAELVISSWAVDPASAIWVVMLIFLVGIALSLVGWGVDRYNQRFERRTQQGRVTRLVKLGYTPTAISLEPALPVAAAGPRLTGWARGDATLLDYPDAERLRDLAQARWDALAAGEASGAVGDSILLDVHLEHWVRNVRGSASLRIKLLEPREKEQERAIDLTANDHGLFDVSELVG
jgi:hypothetical protein